MTSKKQTTRFPFFWCHIRYWVVLIAVPINMFISVPLGDGVFIIVCRGTDAYFEQGLRVSNSKHGILSNGEKLSGLENVLRGTTMLTITFAITGAVNSLVGVLKKKNRETN